MEKTIISAAFLLVGSLALSAIVFMFDPGRDETHPPVYDSYDFAGKNTTVSGVLATNKGTCQFINGRWVTVSYDSSETNRPVAGVTC